MSQTPEGKIQAAVLKRLKKQGIFCWRQNNLAVYDPKMNGYRAHTGLKGVPDILAVINGIFTGFEIKTPRGKQSVDQVLFEKRCKRHGGAYHVIRDVKDLDKIGL